MQEPWRVSELVSQLKHAQVPMTEIAGMDSYQLRWVYARERDKHGRLIRGGGDEPQTDSDGMRVVTDPVPFSRMFSQVWSRRGVAPERVAAIWELWKRENPHFAAKHNA